jgi:hypothetical protein
MSVCLSLLGNEAIMGSRLSAPRQLLCNTHVSTMETEMFSVWLVGWLYNEFQMKFSLVQAGMKIFQFSSRSSLAQSSSQQFQISPQQEIAKKGVCGGRRPQQ